MAHGLVLENIVAKTVKEFSTLERYFLHLKDMVRTPSGETISVTVQDRMGAGITVIPVNRTLEEVQISPTKDTSLEDFSVSISTNSVRVSARFNGDFVVYELLLGKN